MTSRQRGGQGPDDRHRNRQRTLSDQARPRLDTGAAAKPGGEPAEEPRTAAVQGKQGRSTQHD